MGIMTFHGEVLNILLKYREKNPAFNFVAHQLNRKGKLDDGYYFQGNDRYAFAGIINKSGGLKMTKSVGLIFFPLEDHLMCDFEIKYKGETDEDLVAFYEKLKLIFPDGEHVADEYFKVSIGAVDPANPENVYRFLDKFYPKIRALVEESSVKKLIISDEKFDKILENIKKSNDINYWIFQGSPEIYDIKGALRAGHLKSWKVTAHKDSINPGDKVIIWQSGKEAGCYALAEVISEVGSIEEDPAEKQYYKVPHSTETNFGVKIKIINNLADNPVLWEEIKELPEFKNFKAGNQGTNFSATKEEFETIVKMAPTTSKIQYWLYSPGKQAEHWEEFYKEGIMAIGWDGLGDLENYFSKEEIIEKLQEWDKSNSSKKNDATACDDFQHKVKIGDVIIVKQGKRTLLGQGVVTSDYFYDPKRPYFQKCRKVDWKHTGNWTTSFDIVTKTLTDITPYKTQDSNYQTYYERLLGIMAGNKEIMERKNQMNLNKILYGPPGTGKTFKLQNDFFDQFTVRETSLSRKQYLENLISELTWWQVITIVMIDLKSARNNEIYEHELIKIKEGLSKSESIKQTLWGQLQVHTKMECENVKYKARTEPLYFWKDKNSVWTVDEELVKDLYPEAFSLLEKSKNYSANPDKQIKNYEFVTFHQSFSYEDFVEGIKPKMEEQENDLSYEIKDGIFKKLCLRATADPENQYAIFIDEINRGNVSSIFGELITLIEDDKRIGEENALTVKLPYSKKEFGIPTNLHVIGTMNTADRSVEALDTALRRRFTFEEIMPLPHLLSNISFNGFYLDEVLSTINKRIEALLDRDHCIGHSYFIKISNGDTKALEQTFQNKIIPLLQEYFYHDYEKIALILGEGFVERKEEIVKFASFKNLEDPEFIASYELKKGIMDIEAAVKKLLNRNHEEAE